MKWTVGIIIGFILGSAVSVVAAPNLASKLQGKILLAVQDKGKTYWVAPDGYRYRVTVATAQRIFEKLALGISNVDLATIPEKNVGIDPEQVVLGVRTESQCDYSPYVNQINQLKATYNNEHAVCNEFYLKNKDIIDMHKAAKEKAEQDTIQYSNLLNQTNATLNQYITALDQAIDIAKKWQQKYYDAVGQINQQNQQIVTPVIKCFYGTTVECFDLSTFPQSVLDQIAAVNQQPMTQQRMEGEKLRIIHNYLGY